MAVTFRHVDKREGGSFQAWSRLADVVPVPEKSSSSDVGDYRPISITSLLLKVFEKIVAGRLSHF